MQDFLWQAFVTLLVIVDPFVVVPIFISLSMHDDQDHQKKTTRKACLIALLLLMFFASVGDKLLAILGISESAFRIAGGFLLLLASIEMVMAKSTGLRAPTTIEEKEASKREDISVFPLAIPLIAGPGSMTSVVVLMHAAEPMGLLAQLGVIAVTVLVLWITYLTMCIGRHLMRILGVTGMNVLTRVFGVIVAALATQNILNGTTALIATIQSTK